MGPQSGKYGPASCTMTNGSNCTATQDFIAVVADGTGRYDAGDPFDAWWGDDSWRTAHETLVLKQDPSKPTYIDYVKPSQLGEHSEQAANITYRHQIVTSPGDHCLEITIPGGSDSPFWKAEGWKYSAPDRPEWVEGQCDKAKWKTQDSKTDSYDGYTAAKNSPYDSVFLIKYGLEGQVTIPWFRVNPALQASSQAAEAAQNKPERTEPPKTREQKKVALKAEARAAHKAQEYEFHQDDQTLVFTLVGMLVMFLFVMVYMAVKRRQQKRYALEAMHMTVVESGSDAKDTSPSAPPLPDSAHDQL